MPRKNRALHARRIFVNAGEYGEFADIAIHLAGRHHFAHLLEGFFSVGFRFAFDVFREQRRGGFRDTTAGAGKASVLDDVAVEREK